MSNKIYKRKSKWNKILTKKFLQKEYINKDKTMVKIIKKIGCSCSTIRKYLIKFNIKIRNRSEARQKQQKYPHFNKERHRKYYCKELNCSNVICYDTWKSGGKSCRSCSAKKRFSRPENNNRYIDGRTPLRDMIRHLKESEEWRNSIFERDNYTCQECGDNRGHNLNAHHKKQFAELLSEFLHEYDQFSPIEDKETLVRLAMKWQSFWEISNGKTLCEDCHKNIKRLEKSEKETNGGI